MAAAQIHVCGSVSRCITRSVVRLPHSPLLSRISSPDRAELKASPFRLPIRVSNISGRKRLISMCLDGNSSRSNIRYADDKPDLVDESIKSSPTAEVVDEKMDIRYADDKPDLVDESIKSSPTAEVVDEKMETEMHAQNDSVVPTKRSAKIHDFCLGIPFGGLLFAGGLLGFIFSRNATGMIFGGAILALSAFSLKVWSTGRSSLPFVLGQAAFSAALVWKQLQAYASSKKLFPSWIYIGLSAAMICFYSYVLVSGGNPPPKLAAAHPS